MKIKTVKLQGRLVNISFGRHWPEDGECTFKFNARDLEDLPIYSMRPHSCTVDMPAEIKITFKE